MPPTTIQISKKALLHNLKQIKKIVSPNVEVMPVIKSNAYGHGMLKVADVLKKHTRYFVVASPEEALQLRAHGIRTNILVLGNIDWSNTELIQEAVKEQIDMSVYNREGVDSLRNVAKKMHHQGYVHIKIDTGMSRYGVQSDVAQRFIDSLASKKEIAIRGIYSHLSSADENTSFTAKQILLFKKNFDGLKKRGIAIVYNHIGNTAGIFRKDTPGNAVRFGIGLYGLYPSKWSKKQVLHQHPKFSLKPVLQWKTKIMQIKRIKEGTPVSYGRTYVASKDMTIGVLPIGYWDGYDRGLSNCGYVLVRGLRCSVLGRVCMNQTVIAVDGIKEPHVGEDVVLLGKQNKAEISADEIAERLGTINYEIVTRINPLLPRLVV